VNAESCAVLCDVNAEGHSVVSIALHANKQRMRGHVGGAVRRNADCLAAMGHTIKMRSLDVRFDGKVCVQIQGEGGGFESW
jgi:hypothetical protein